MCYASSAPELLAPRGVRRIVSSMIRASIALALVAGCGGAGRGPVATTPDSPAVVDMEEMRIRAQRTEDGSIELDSYDAETLFHRAHAHVAEGRCERGVTLYLRVADEFPASRYASPALYNAGLCLQQEGRAERAVTLYRRLLSTSDAADVDVKHASFQLAKLYVDLERWQDAVGISETLLAREDLSSDERVEAMSRRAQGLLGLDRLDDAAAQARATLSHARTRPEEERVRDDYYLGAASFVLAEVLRIRASRVEIPEGDVTTQRAVLERRAQLILDAQRTYFDTIRQTDAHWAAAAGYRIGAMYDAFWHAIDGAPVPPPRTPIADENMPYYVEEYRNELRRLIKPLIRHSIRYWELTLMMVERTGVHTEWTQRIREDLERARQRLLEQPEGRGGLPAPDAADTPGPSSLRPGDVLDPIAAVPELVAPPSATSRALDAASPARRAVAVRGARVAL